MQSTLYDIGEVIRLIHQERTLILAGDEELLDLLPKGNWIGGSACYFSQEQGVVYTKDQLFVWDMTEVAEDFKICTYNEASIHTIGEDGFDHGFSFVIMPVIQPILLTYALNFHTYKDIYKNPITGFISLVPVEDIDRVPAKVYNGTFDQNYGDAAALHIKLPLRKRARLDVLNFFEQDEILGELRVLESGFQVKACSINGIETNLADYIKAKQFDVRFPLTCKDGGRLVNISIYGVDHQKKLVLLSAPVFKDKVYRFAKVLDYSRYADRYIAQIPKDTSMIIYSCVCLWHYLHGALAGKSLKLPGIFTGGELAWQLYNQTAVNLIVEDVQF
ncbi:MAG: hypothetical protein AAF934_07320 [Bacteroidota bacterium]